MKLIVCGKGGSGKSTVSALLARNLAKNKKRVVVMDTDVSNGGLHRIIGTEPAADLVGHFGGPKAMKAKLKEVEHQPGGTETSLLCNWSFDTIPADFSPKYDGVRLVTIAKLWDASEGCTCSISALARQFLLGLDLKQDDVLIVDTEAGVEHFGRGLDKLCDAILMVIDPSFESVCLSKKVLEMAASIETPLFFVLNRTDPATREALQQALPEQAIVLGDFPSDPDLMKAGLEGNAVPYGYQPAQDLFTSLISKLKEV